MPSGLAAYLGSKRRIPFNKWVFSGPILEPDG
jgi:hypothetical protein